MVEKTQDGDASLRLELLKLLFVDFRYKHENYWRLVIRFSGVVLVLALLPFLYQKDYGYLEQIYWIFPLISVLLAGVAVVILQAEYKRLVAVGREITQIRRDLNVPTAPRELGILARVRIGPLVNTLFVAFAGTAGILSFLVFHFVVMAAP